MPTPKSIIQDYLKFEAHKMIVNRDNKGDGLCAKKRVKSVILFFPNTDNGNDYRWEVGVGGVTEISEVVYSPSPFCEKTYYLIFDIDDCCLARVDHFSVIEYFKEEPCTVTA